MPFDRYFDKRSRQFAAFYGNERLSRALGRGPLFDRLRFTVDKAVSNDAKHVLDIGCGSGPLFEPLASRGIRVTGIEPAPQMLELARTQAARFPGLVDLREGSWETLDEEDGYDMAVALGVLDYVDTPEDLLRRMGKAAPSVVASFPSPGIRTDLRKVRYGLRGVRVHGYERQRLFDLAKGAGLTLAELAPLGRAGYVALFLRA